MKEDISPDRLLDVAKASPAAVASHDRNAWIALFARHGIIEDPIGSKPHHNGLHDSRSGVRGPGPLERFYDTFIAPNDIAFHVDRDIVARPFVLRDLTIELTMAAGLHVRVPMHVVYEITEEGGVLKIAHLRAHWELVPMVRQVLGNGWPGVVTMNRLGLRMIGNQGIGAVLGFSRGMLGIHGAGKRTVACFVDAANGRNKVALAALFGRGNAGIRFRTESEILDPESFCERLGGILSVTKLISSGYVTSCTFTVRSGDSESHGVGLFEFNSRSRKLHSACLYCE
jgi:hypothetical protein